jgi:hypothetical protein
MIVHSDIADASSLFARLVAKSTNLSTDGRDTVWGMAPGVVRTMDEDMRNPLPRLALLALTLACAPLAGASASADAATSVRHLYGVAQVGQTWELVPFDVSATGQFSERQTQSVSLSSRPASVLVSRDARTVYVGSTGGYDDNDDRIPGTILVFAVAADGSLTPQQTVLAPPRQMLLTPDGSRLIEWDDYGLVVSFPIQRDGTLGAARANPTVTGSARDLAVGPDGSTLYVATYPQQLEQYAIGSDGALTARTPSELGIFGCRADFLGVTPDGTNLDATCYNQGITLSLAPGGGLTFNGSLFTTWGGSPSVEDVRGRALYKAIYPNALEHMQRRVDGTLVDFATPLLFDGARVSGIAADPGGTRLAVANSANALETYAIAPDGSLSSGPVTSIPTTRNALSQLVYSPDQPPIAAFGADRAGTTVHFDASASAAVNGTIARYDWTFGDGSALADGGPAPSHTYASPGDYTATLVLTDNAGCSTAETYTGVMSICAGSPNAASSQSVHLASEPVPPPPPPPPATTATPQAEATTPLPSSPAPSQPPVLETLVVPHSLTGTPAMGGGKVRLAWTPAPDAPASKRYLVAWSTLHSAQGPSDRLMHHVWTTGTHLLMAGARRVTTLHYAVYAYGSDGLLAKAAKTTVRLPRSG